MCWFEFRFPIKKFTIFAFYCTIVDLTMHCSVVQVVLLSFPLTQAWALVMCDSHARAAQVQRQHGQIIHVVIEE